MYKNNFKRILAVLLVAITVIGAMPKEAFASQFDYRDFRMNIQSFIDFLNDEAIPMIPAEINQIVTDNMADIIAGNFDFSIILNLADYNIIKRYGIERSLYNLYATARGVDDGISTNSEIIALLSEIHSLSLLPYYEYQDNNFSINVISSYLTSILEKVENILEERRLELLPMHLIARPFIIRALEESIAAYDLSIYGFHQPVLDEVVWYINELQYTSPEIVEAIDQNALYIITNHSAFSGDDEWTFETELHAFTSLQIVLQDLIDNGYHDMVVYFGRDWELVSWELINWGWIPVYGTGTILSIADRIVEYINHLINSRDYVNELMYILLGPVLNEFIYVLLGSNLSEDDWELVDSMFPQNSVEALWLNLAILNGSPASMGNYLRLQYLNLAVLYLEGVIDYELTPEDARERAERILWGQE